MGRKTKKQITAEKISKAVSKMTDENVNKLKEVFAIDGTIEEACYYAGISRQTYYDWLERKPELIDEFDALRNRPVLKARQTVVKSLDQPQYAFEYLKRKKRLEFGDSSDVTSGGKPLQVVFDNAFTSIPEKDSE